MKRWVLFLNLLLFFLIKFQCGNSNNITSNPIDQQQKDRVLELPGLSVNVNFSHYSGYVRVNEKSKRTLFYWFFEAVEEPFSKPIVLWLQGGPGCSSIALGEAEEIGPFHVNADGKSLYVNPYSWNQVANILFLDSPVGTGFSYTNDPSELLTNGDQRTADDSLVFLLKWFERFPQYKGRDFYITGESYAGHFIPQLAQAIVRYKWSAQESSINLKGYMVGNALTDDFNDHSGVSEFLWSTGLISDQTYKLRKIYCHHVSFLHSSDDCKKISDVVSTELGKIDIYSIYTPFCTRNVSDSDSLKRFKNNGSNNEKYDPCTRQYSSIYFNLPAVQKALHVNPEAAPPKWEACRASYLDVQVVCATDDPVYSMFDSGDTDTVIPVTSTRYNIDALGLPPASPWRPWYDDGQVGGWTQQFTGLNFVTVRGAGHEIPRTRPKLGLVLFKSFLSGSPMPSLSPRITDS
ncbi:Serine carboxypeptidase-like [Thalictrum thalictroides]|uniref:Carboxypeptidase n=1 Tax=Thalictrum thalictroides TaxID=46969 RepID=A0A7J6XD23_THATH|nr:Serine carboxypeptidase-like [Thalictrum thalictroides]